MIRTSGSNSETEATARGPEQQTHEAIVDASLENIKTLQSEIATALQVDVNSVEATQATDQELIKIAEMSVETPGVALEKEQAAFNDAAVESALEADSGINVEATPIAALEFGGYGGNINDVVARLHESHATLPNGHEAAPLLIAAVDKLNSEMPKGALEGAQVELSSASEKTGEVSQIEKSLDTARQSASEKARAGIERSEFNSPEVNKAIEGYFTDHEVTLTTLKSLMDATETNVSDLKTFENTKLGLENATLSVGIDRLISLKEQGNEKDFNELAKGMLQLVYCEPSVGQLTLDNSEVQRIAQSKADIAIELDHRLGHSTDSARQLEHEIQAIQGAGESARNEVRNAGQLLFHNTAYGQEVWQQGALRGRTQQGETQDAVMTTTADMAGHSVSTHWSEVYDPHGYKQKTSKQFDSDTLEPQALTYAVPLGEMIKKAPYARGLEYAVVEAKADTRVYTASVGGSGSEVTGSIGSGSADMTGAGTPSMDRVFWAPGDTATESAGYDVPIIGDETVIYNPKTGNRESAVYQIQSESDMLTGFHGNKKQGTEEDHRFIAQRSEKEVVYEYGKRIDHNSGTGYGYPERRIIEDMNYATEPGTGGAAFQHSAFDIQQSAAEPVIREIEKESMDRFQGQYVVPLRAKESSFMFKADGSVARRFGDPIEYLMRKTEAK
jgi:hypothetical protein